MADHQATQNIPSSLEDSYETKTEHYFAGVRDDMLALIDKPNPETAANGLSILEIGCGRGSTGKLALEQKIASQYIGVELMEDAASEAKKWLSHVEIGNAETMNLEKFGSFDVIICSEVLEHLQDPWAMVEKLSQRLKKGGVIIASSPNIASKNIIISLLRGNFEYSEFGIMDRTHLRWFAPQNYRAMFEDLGLQVEIFQPVRAISWKAKLINLISLGKLHHLFWTQTMVKVRKL